MSVLLEEVAQAFRLGHSYSRCNTKTDGTALWYYKRLIALQMTTYERKGMAFAAGSGQPTATRARLNAVLYHLGVSFFLRDKNPVVMYAGIIYPISSDDIGFIGHLGDDFQIFKGGKSLPPDIESRWKQYQWESYFS